MQQILFYREMGIPLANIKQILDDPAFDVLDALEKHKIALEKQSQRLKRLQATMNKTILFLRGETRMDDNEFFEGFSEEQQERYAKEAEQMYDADTVKASNRRWKGYSTEKKKLILEEGKQIYMDFLAAMPGGAASPEVQNCVDHWRKHMAFFWTPDLDQLNGLAELYNSEPRFKANFDKIDPRLAEFMREAISMYVKEQKLKND
jgi:DNA-binding transcriptional MerR regulator